MRNNKECLLEIVSDGDLAKYIDSTEYSVIDRFRWFAFVNIDDDADYYSEMYRLGRMFNIARTIDIWRGSGVTWFFLEYNGKKYHTCKGMNETTDNDILKMKFVEDVILGNVAPDKEWETVLEN